MFVRNQKHDSANDSEKEDSEDDENHQQVRFFWNTFDLVQLICQPKNIFCRYRL